MCILMRVTAIGVVVMLTGQAQATDSPHGHGSAYAGQENRPIKSLSAEDMAELKAGSGWGLAKAAELNGVPGPGHLLEMKEAIALSDQQVVEIERLFQQMNKAARALGQKLIDQERVLEARFQGDIPDAAELKLMLDDIGVTRSELRFVHLSAHLKTPDILTQEQIKMYNRLRGYASNNPCEDIPQGHDATMWKKHNNCQ